MQQSQTIEIAVVKDKGRITQIGKTSMLQPRINFSGGSMKWYEDKPKKKTTE